MKKYLFRSVNKYVIKNKLSNKIIVRETIINLKHNLGKKYDFNEKYNNNSFKSITTEDNSFGDKFIRSVGIAFILIIICMYLFEYDEKNKIEYCYDDQTDYCCDDQLEY